jgi:hypothetical protein
VAPGQSVRLAAAMEGRNVPARSTVRWVSQDSTVFRLDTVGTTVGTSVHEAVGLGRASGTTHVVVTTDRQQIVVPVTVSSAFSVSGAAVP